MTPEAIRDLSRADKTMRRLIQKVGPCRLKPRTRRSPFEALVRAITYQQLNGTAAAAILKRVLALYPDQRFPAPEDLLKTSVARLRGAGLSGAKAAALKDLAAQTVSGVVPPARIAARLSDAELVKRLTAVRGVGPWTVEMYLIFTLGRVDVLPVTDFGVRKGFAVTYGWEELPKPAELLEFGERWRPHRTTAAWYLWRSLDLPA